MMACTQPRAMDISHKNTGEGRERGDARRAEEAETGREGGGGVRML